MPGFRFSRLAFLSLATGLAFSIAQAADGPGAGAAQKFATASVHFEQNATDGDYEVVFQVKGGKEGLAELSVTGPDGRTVISFAASGQGSLGMRQFRFESPEPPDAAKLQAAYPEGEYAFRGKTITGGMLEGRATLTHRLPAIATVLGPGAKVNKAAANRISWRGVSGASGYVVEVKSESSGIVARLPATSTSFAAPGDFFLAGKTYKLSIGTVGPEGNISFVETSYSVIP